MTASNAEEQARAALQHARAAIAAGGTTYALALAHLRAANALLALGAPPEALADCAAADQLVAALRSDPAYDTERLVALSSPALPPPTAGEAGNIDELDGWNRVARATALTRLGQREEAAAVIESARPLAKGWGRRHLRKALDQVAGELTKAGVLSPGFSDDADATLAALDRVISDRTSSDAEKLDARYRRACVLLDTGRAEDAARECLLALRDCTDDRLAAATRQLLGSALFLLDREAEAAESLRAAYDGYRSLGDDDAVAAAAPGLASLLSGLGRHGEAVDVLEAAVASARAAGNPLVEANVLLSLGSARDATGRTRGAIVAFEEAAVAAAAAGDPVRVADAQHGDAVVRATRLIDERDEAVEALTLLDAARDAYFANGFPDRAAGCQHEAAALLGRLGSLDAARSRYEAALADYLALPEDQRDSGTWPDEVADCEANLEALRRGESGTFASGGHRMSHS